MERTGSGGCRPCRSTADTALAEEPRTAISLRLPPSLVKTVEQFAAEHRLSKTDAFLHFLTKGIEADREAASSETLARIERKVSETLSLMRRQCEDISDKELVVEAVRRTCHDFPSIRRACLFGSFARGAHDSESDVDIRLEIDPHHRFSLHDLEQFAKRVEDATGRSADIITARSLKNKALEAEIERDKELIYNREA